MTQVSKSAKSRRFDFPILIAVLICLAVAVPIVAIIVRSVHYQFNFRSFTGAMSNATLYCYENDSLCCEISEDRIRVNGDNAYLLYDLFTDTPAKPRHGIPEEAPNIHLDYGNGAALDCWQMRLEENAERWYGVLWRFTDSEGKSWTYDTDDFGLQDVERLVTLSKNQNW